MYRRDRTKKKMPSVRKCVLIIPKSKQSALTGISQCPDGQYITVLVDMLFPSSLPQRDHLLAVWLIIQQSMGKQSHLWDGDPISNRGFLAHDSIHESSREGGSVKWQSFESQSSPLASWGYLPLHTGNRGKDSDWWCSLRWGMLSLSVLSVRVSKHSKHASVLNAKPASCTNWLSVQAVIHYIK